MPVHDADQAVHRLYAGEAAALIEAEFAGTTGAGGVDRQKLSARVLHDGISQAVYGAVRGGLRAAVRGAATLVALQVPETEAPLDSTPAGSVSTRSIRP